MIDHWFKDPKRPNSDPRIINKRALDNSMTKNIYVVPELTNNSRSALFNRNPSVLFEVSLLVLPSAPGSIDGPYEYHMLWNKPYNTTCYERSFISKYHRAPMNGKVGTTCHPKQQVAPPACADWKNRCNLPPSTGKLHLRHLPISEIGYGANIIKLRPDVF